MTPPILRCAGTKFHQSLNTKNMMMLISNNSFDVSEELKTKNPLIWDEKKCGIYDLESSLSRPSSKFQKIAGEPKIFCIIIRVGHNWKIVLKYCSKVNWCIKFLCQSLYAPFDSIRLIQFPCKSFLSINLSLKFLGREENCYSQVYTSEYFLCFLEYRNRYLSGRKVPVKWFIFQSFQS